MIFTFNLICNILCVFITLFLCFLTFVHRRYSYWSRKGVYTKRIHFPFGNAKDFFKLKKSLGVVHRDLYLDIKERGLRYGGAYLMFSSFFIPTDLNIIKSIMHTDFSHFMDRGFYVNEKGDPLSANLFMLDDIRWKDLRVKLTPTFSSGKTKMMFNMILECGRNLSDTIKGFSKTSIPIEVKDLMQRFTLDIIGSCAFGIDCNCLRNPNSEWAAKGRLIFEPNLENALRAGLSFTLPHNLLRLFNIKLIQPHCADFFMNIIKDTVNYREEKNLFRKDFMHLLIQLKNRGQVYDDEKLWNENGQKNQGMQFNEIAAQAFIFFLAGYETSSTTLTFTLYELAQRPDLQQKIRLEIETVLKKYNGELTYDALKEMTYTDKVLFESLRKYPPVPLLTRVCNKSYKIPGSDVQIEKGDSIAISTLGIHHDSAYYPNPEIFDPERFNEDVKNTRPKYAWIPFGEGPRICIGLRFGMLQSKVGLVTILKDYEISLHNNTIVPLQFEPKIFVLTAQGGVWINIKKINQ